MTFSQRRVHTSAVALRVQVRRRVIHDRDDVNIEVVVRHRRYQHAWGIGVRLVKSKPRHELVGLRSVLYLVLVAISVTSGRLQCPCGRDVCLSSHLSR